MLLNGLSSGAKAESLQLVSTKEPTELKQTTIGQLLVLTICLCVFETIVNPQFDSGVFKFIPEVLWNRWLRMVQPSQLN